MNLLTSVVLAMASVGPMSLEELTNRSDLIVVGRVTRVVELQRQPTCNEEGKHSCDFFAHSTSARIAELVPERVLKGQVSTPTIAYLAQGTWTCDITTAVEGERVLLFLWREPEKEKGGERAALGEGFVRAFGDRPLHVVMHAGRGRMPLYQFQERDFASYYSDSDTPFPDSIELRHAPNRGVGFTNSASLDDIAHDIPEILALKGRPSWQLSVTGDAARGSAWELTVKRDRSALLAVKTPEVSGLQGFTIPAEVMRDLRAAAANASDLTDGMVLGPASGAKNTCTLTFLSENSRRTVTLHDIDTDPSDAAQLALVRHARELASILRATVSDPRCIDYPKAHAATLEKLRAKPR